MHPHLHTAAATSQAASAARVATWPRVPRASVRPHLRAATEPVSLSAHRSAADMGTLPPAMFDGLPGQTDPDGPTPRAPGSRSTDALHRSVLANQRAHEVGFREGYEQGHDEGERGAYHEARLWWLTCGLVAGTLSTSLGWAWATGLL